MLSACDYQELVEQAPILVWRSDVNGACDYFNDRWLTFRGRSLEQEVGDGWATGVHPDDLGGCLQTYLGAFGRRETFEMYYRLQRSDGAYRWIFDRGTPRFDAAGGFRGYIGSCIDVTERIEAEQALQKLREAEFSNLRRLLPICANCRQIRNDAGYWQRVEEYVSAHSKTEFSHCICPTCMSSLYPEYTR